MKRLALLFFFLAAVVFIFARGQGSEDVPAELYMWRELTEGKYQSSEEKQYDADYCVKCPVTCKEEEKDKSDPLHKWRCVECERVCGEIKENEE